MKKKAMSLMTAAMMLTLAWMTGCGSEPDGTSSAAKTASGTEATTVDTTAVTVEETEAEGTDAEAVDSADNQVFTTYDEFLDAIGAAYPGVVLVAPTQIVSGEWELSQIYFLDTGTQPLYEYVVKTPAGDSLMLTVSHDIQFDSPDDLKADVSAEEGVSVQEGYTGTNWLVCQIESPEAYALYGMTGDENVYYTLLGTDTEGNTLEPEALQSYHDTLRL